MSCEYCKQSKFPGVHLPSDFDDRKPSANGKVFVAKCDECWLNKYDPCYENDLDAAQVIAKATGWPIHKSFDSTDAIDPEERASRTFTAYYRPYFAVTLADAEKVWKKNE